MDIGVWEWFVNWVHSDSAKYVALATGVTPFLVFLRELIALVKGFGRPWPTKAYALTLLFVPIMLFGFRYLTDPPSWSLEKKIKDLWQLYNRGLYADAVYKADTLLQKYKHGALYKEKQLCNEPSTQQIISPGIRQNEEAKQIYSFSPINEVAAILWIKADSYRIMKDTNKAIQNFQELRSFPHGLVSDTKGGFWSPYEYAESYLIFEAKYKCECWKPSCDCISKPCVPTDKSPQPFPASVGAQ